MNSHNSLISESGGTTKALIAAFKKKTVCTLGDLKRVLKASRSTVFRAIRHLEYFSSYSHAGKFYALNTTPSFDSRGLWFHHDIGFSKYGTLRATIVVMVKGASAGCTHEEMRAVLQFKIHNTLHDLVRDGLIDRVQIAAVYLYVATDKNVSMVQIEKRKAMEPPLQDRPIDLADVVEILLVVIRKPKVGISEIRDILGAKGLVVSDREVADVLGRYDIKKKSKTSPSRRLRM